MPHLSLHLLGPPRIEVGGEQIELNRRKAIALLAYLAVTGQDHSRDALAALFWPEASQRQARAGLRNALWTLNKSPLGDWLAAETAESVNLKRDETLWVDVLQFHELLAAPRRHDHRPDEVCPDCLDALTEAVSLYHDDFLAGFTLPDAPDFDEWQFFQSEGLRRNLAEALEILIRLHSARGDFESAIPHARRHLALDPTHEAAHRTLMQLYAQSGQQAAALRQYQVCRETLEAELGLVPSEETTALYESIRAGALSLSAGEKTGKKELSPTPTPLPPHSPTFLIGGRYEIIDQATDLIGQGSMGHVFKGRDTQNGDIVAIKALRADFAAPDPELIERFAREGEALRQLNHPNIVGLLAAVEEGGQPYLVMEYVSGGSLRDRLEQAEPLSLQRILAIGIELCDALAQTHYRKIVHRDLKPGNVLLTEDGTPRLTDFGVARLGQAERVTQTGTAIGTLDYLSPEALNGEAVDARADIWSLGVLLFEMLTRQRPFGGETPTEVLTAILTKPAPNLSSLRPDLPSPLLDLVDRMLKKDPKARIPSVRLVGAELEAILESGEKWNGTVAKIINCKSEIVNRHNLPPQPTPFIGRETELAELANLLAAPNIRLVTITGPGGMGKTRLALAGAEGQLSQPAFSNGVYFVPLASLSEPEAIIPAIAKVVDYPFQGDGRSPQQQLLDYFREKQMLLVLDNFEHLLNGVDFVAGILQTAPQVKILATSRERLQLQEEQVYPLRGLTTPVAGSAAVELFMQSARRSRPDFAVAPADEPHLATICRLVEGMPLGLELAASWVDMLSLADIVAEIQNSLDFLETELRNVPERHRSMRAVFDASWQRLSESEQQVFAQLSVFRGGFTREAAKEVAGASLRTLAALANKSLLRFSQQRDRYEIHELLRQYASEALERSPERYQAIQDAHSGYCTTFLKQQAGGFHGPQQSKIVAQIEAEIDNIRLAWKWAVRNERVDEINQAIDCLGAFYEHRGPYHEGLLACQMAAEQLARPDFDLEKLPAGRVSIQFESRERGWALVKLLRWQSIFSLELGDTEGAQHWLRLGQALIEALDGGRKQAIRQRAGLALGQLNLAVRRSDFTAIHDLAPETVRLAQAGGDVYLEVESRMKWGGPLCYLVGDYQAAREQYEKALNLAREARLPYSEASILHNLAGVLFFSNGSYVETLSHLQEALSMSRQIGHRLTEGWVLNKLGYVIVEHGDDNYGQAEAHYRQGLDIILDVSNRSIEVTLQANLGVLYDQMGDYARSKICLEDALYLNRTTKSRQNESRMLSYLANLYRSQGNYDAARTYYQRALSLLGEIKFRQLEGRTFSEFGLFYHQTGNDEAALDYSQQGLKISQEIGCKRDQAYALTRIGHAYVGLGRLENGAASYQQALQIHAQMEQVNRAMEAQAGLARIALAQDKLSLARNYVEQILERLNVNENATYSLFEPLRVHLTCYRVLQEHDDSRTVNILATAHNILQTRAATIEAEAAQQLFLQNVIVHRELIATYELTSF